MRRGPSPGGGAGHDGRARLVDVKLPVYARAAVPHVWLLDPALRRLEVLRPGAGGYRAVETCHGDEAVRAEPFDALELSLGLLWER